LLVSRSSFPHGLSHSQQSGFEQPPDFVVKQSLIAQSLNQIVHALPRRLNTVAKPSSPPIHANERTGSVVDCEDTFVLKLRICFRNGAGADHKLLGESPNAWKLIAIPQGPTLNGVADLLHQLKV
jgi:hypothetical protein